MARIHPRIQVRPPAHEIDHLARERILEQRVDREIAPQHVRPRIGLEADLPRMPAVQIGVLADEKSPPATPRRRGGPA